MLIAAFFKVQQQLINTRRGGGAQGLKLAPPPGPGRVNQMEKVDRQRLFLKLV